MMPTNVHLGMFEGVVAAGTAPFLPGELLANAVALETYSNK